MKKIVGLFSKLWNSILIIALAYFVTMFSVAFVGEFIDDDHNIISEFFLILLVVFPLTIIGKRYINRLSVDDNQQ